MSLIRAGVVLPLLAGVAGFLYFAYGRAYPLELALLIGAALMMLVWAGARTFKGLRDLNRD